MVCSAQKSLNLFSWSVHLSLWLAAPYQGALPRHWCHIGVTPHLLCYRVQGPSLVSGLTEDSRQQKPRNNLPLDLSTQVMRHNSWSSFDYRLDNIKSQGSESLILVLKFKYRAYDRREREFSISHITSMQHAINDCLGKIFKRTHCIS